MNERLRQDHSLSLSLFGHVFTRMSRIRGAKVIYVALQQQTDSDPDWGLFEEWHLNGMNPTHPEIWPTSSCSRPGASRSGRWRTAPCWLWRFSETWLWFGLFWLTSGWELSPTISCWTWLSPMCPWLLSTRSLTSSTPRTETGTLEKCTAGFTTSSRSLRCSPASTPWAR